MNIEEQKLLAAKIWAHHGEALEFLLARKPNQLSKLRNSVFSEQFLSQLSHRLKTDGTDVRVVLDSTQGRYVNLAIPEWDGFDGMKSAAGWRPSGRAFLFEASIRDTLFAFRAVIGPGDRQAREKLVEVVKGSGVPLGRSKFSSDKFTRVNTKSILKKSEMANLIEEGAHETDVLKIQSAISTYLIACVPKYHVAFQALRTDAIAGH